MNPFVKFAEAVKAVFPEETRFSLTVVPATPPPGSSPDAMLNLNEAAAILGYKPAGLRKIVAATKAGKPGPTIQFAQVGRGPIRFRRQWLDDFITGNIVKRPVKKRPKSKQPPAESKHGFNNQLYNL